MPDELSKLTVSVQHAFAVIVGIATYKHPQISRLAYTRADAEAFYQLLVDPEHVSFPPDNIKLLLDEQGTLANLKSALGGWLRKKATPDSTIFVFFAGHGGQEADVTGSAPDRKASYLLPWDADPEDLFTTALPNDDFNKYLRAIAARRVVVFLDACHSGGVARRGARDVGTISLPSFDLLAEGEGRVVVAAAKPDQRSWEDDSLGHGIFTHHLLEAFGGKADLNGDGYVSIREAVEYLEHHIPQTARRLGKEPQEPYLVSEGAGEIILAVDRERIRRRREELDKEEQERQRKLKEHRAQLNKLRDDGAVVGPIYVEALSLIERPADELSTTEKLLRENLEALLRGGMGLPTYMANRRFILGDAGGSRGPKPGPREPAVPAAPRRFCVHCGTANAAQNLFCIGCGRRFQS